MVAEQGIRGSAATSMADMKQRKLEEETRVAAFVATGER